MSKLITCCLFLSLCLPVKPTFSGTWQVIPIRLDFDQRSRSGLITVTNDSDDRISFSIDAQEWTQDFEGKDQYSETKDLLFFPKALTIGPHEERVIRAGVKIPAISKEKTYRLFIKQETSPEERSGTTVAIAIRFGVPIFSKPMAEEVKGDVIEPLLQQGTLSFGLKNTGNVHFRVAKIQLSGMDASGSEVFSQELNGGYLLAGIERSFATVIPKDLCPDLHNIDIQIISDRIHLNGTIDVDKAKCLAP